MILTYVKWIGKVITILPLGDAKSWKTKEKIITKAICFKLFKYLNKEILEKISVQQTIKENDAFGDGKSAIKIVDIIDDYIKSGE